MTITRRQLLGRAVGLSAAGSLGAALAGCASGTEGTGTGETDPTAGAVGPTDTGVPSTAVAAPVTSGTTNSLPAATTTEATVATPTTAPVDVSRPWWMQGNFGPVADEVESFELTVTGAIPPELSGTYVRNGSNSASGDTPHWFFGDGMLHGIRIRNGRAEWYRNRFVDTTLYRDRVGFGQGPPGGANNQSNVSCIWHGGRLVTSGEVGFPYRIDPESLATVGPDDFAGALTSAFTAHPKVDPVTGRMHSFGYGFTAPFLTYHVTDPDGTMVHTETVDIPRSTMMHDFAITDRDAVFWDLPVVFDLDIAIASVADPSAGFPYRWAPEAGARVGVMPLDGGAGSITWFELDPCFVFHGVNAFRRGDEVVLDVCHLESMFVPGQLLGGTASLRRWTLDTSTGLARQDVLETERSGDLPSRDPRRVGRDYRYGYLASTRDNPLSVDLGGLIKHDFVRDTRETWDPGPTAHSGEWLFVPAGSDTADDAGFLMSYVHDEATGVSEFVIVDATDVTAGPVARVALPQRVPYGFHAAWVPL